MDTQETLVKYIGGFHSYLRYTILIFNPSSLDEVCVQATHLESRRKNVNVDFVKPFKPTEGKFKGKGKEKFKGKKTNTMKKEKLHALIVRKKAIVRIIVVSFTHS